MMRTVYVVRFINGSSIILDKDPLGVLGCTALKLIEYDDKNAVAGKYRLVDEVRVNTANVTYTQPRVLDVVE